MIRSNTSWRTGRVAAILVVLLSLFSASPALAAGDRTPPTKPTNLRVTSTNSYYVSLAWNPSTDNSGAFSYKVWVSYGQTYTVNQAQTTFTLFVAPNSTYSFYVYAVDGSGNRSTKSNTVSATTPRDTTPPTAPALSLVDVNPTEVSLTWSASTDDGPYLMYQVYVNGSPNVDAGTARSAVVHNLMPATSYVITVKARDFYGNNVSAPSNAINVTTDASSGVDTEPPPPISDLTAWNFDPEFNLFWTESFDNQTPQSAIRYEVYVNGVLDHVITGDDRTILYAAINGENTFTVIAVDGAGNRSAPASITVVSQM
jgi:fibronectin type III domain protein